MVTGFEGLKSVVGLERVDGLFWGLEGRGVEVSLGLLARHLLVVLELLG